MCTIIATISEFFFLSTQIMGDLIMTFYYTLSTIFLSYYFISRKNYYLLYASIFAGFMALSKNEGLGLFIVNGLVFLIFNVFYLIKKQKKFKDFIHELLILVVPGIIIYLPW